MDCLQNEPNHKIIKSNKTSKNIHKDGSGQEVIFIAI